MPASPYKRMLGSRPPQQQRLGVVYHLGALCFVPAHLAQPDGVWRLNGHDLLPFQYKGAVLGKDAVPVDLDVCQPVAVS